MAPMVARQIRKREGMRVIVFDDSPLPNHATC
jgi:hypothetical protein